MTELVPRPAATVMLVRDAPRGVEVLMLQRNLQSAFVPGAHIFPGGTVDDDDHSARLHAFCDGLDDAAASARLGIERGGLAYWIAAIRELFEEAGVILARREDGGMMAFESAGAHQRWREHRRRAETGAVDFGDIIGAEGVRLAVDRLVYLSRWITPAGAVRRYDTRFFVAEAPAGQGVEHDNREAIASEWVRPVEVLERYERGECKLRTPTLRTLELFADCATTARLLTEAARQAATPAIEPRIARDGRVVLPGEAGYEEAATVGGRGAWRP